MSGVDAKRRELILAELEQILAGASFRNAKRSQDFLRYIVINTLDGNLDALKERIIGASVFQKPADYDTGDDSTVRVKASELRKRLAQFYVESGREHEVTIALPAGSYVPEFRWAAKPAAAVDRAGSGLAPALAPHRGIRRLWLAGVVVLLCCAAIFAWYSRTNRSAAPGMALEQFWRPVFDNSQPLLLCVANPVVFHLRGRSRYVLDPGAAERPPSVPSVDISRDPNNYVGIGDAFSLAELSGFFSNRGKPFEIRMGNDVSFADLRNSPVVLIGAFTNPWTLEMAQNLRFVFQEGGNAAGSLHDRINPARHWDEDPTGRHDYALISRLFDSRTGDMVIIAAGLSHLGTQIAGEFLTDPARMESAFRGAPRDWPRRNIQIVLEGEIIGKTPGPPKVVDTWFW